MLWGPENTSLEDVMNWTHENSKWRRPREGFSLSRSNRCHLRGRQLYSHLDICNIIKKDLWNRGRKRENRKKGFSLEIESNSIWAALMNGLEVNCKLIKLFLFVFPLCCSNPHSFKCSVSTLSDDPARIIQQQNEQKYLIFTKAEMATNRNMICDHSTSINGMVLD